MSIVCMRCGSETECRQQGYTQIISCTKCNWSLATTNFPKIETDRTIYSLYISEADYKNTAHISAISKVFGMNYLESRRFLLQEEKPIYKGYAMEIMEIKNYFDSIGIKYNIIPTFNY
jgi:hypothetical protein